MTEDHLPAISEPPEPSAPISSALVRTLRSSLLRLRQWSQPGMAQKSSDGYDGENLGPLKKLSRTYPLSTWRPLALLITILVVTFVIWSAFTELDEVAIAQGEVVPETKVKVIQHLEGGIVREIYVKDGTVVQAGTPLLQLELPVTALNRDELQVRIDGLALQRARLQAEAKGDKLLFPYEESKRQPDLTAAEQRSFSARKNGMEKTLSVLRVQKRQKEQEIVELETKEKGLVKNLSVADERLHISSALLKSGLTPRMEKLSLEAQVEDLKAQLDNVRASIPRARIALVEAQQRVEEEEGKFLRSVEGEMTATELDLARNRQLLSQASDQQLRTQITSPTDGVVKNLHANTIGGVIRSGDLIMEVVPMRDRLQIEARLSPTDRGYVDVGQKASVKITAYDYTTYGGLDGIVTLVAPDTTTIEGKEPFYRVVVQTDKAWLGEEISKHLITAGMQATIEIHTGNRTILHYLVKPVLKLRHEAFHER